MVDELVVCEGGVFIKFERESDFRYRRFGESDLVLRGEIITTLSLLPTVFVDTVDDAFIRSVISFFVLFLLLLVVVVVVESNSGLKLGDLGDL